MCWLFSVVHANHTTCTRHDKQGCMHAASCLHTNLLEGQVSSPQEDVLPPPLCVLHSQPQRLHKAATRDYCQGLCDGCRQSAGALVAHDLGHNSMCDHSAMLTSTDCTVRLWDAAS